MRNLQIAIQRWLRRLLGVPSTVDVEAATLRAYEDTRELIRRATLDMQNRASNLKATEDRISARFRELDKAEVEMHRVAAGISVTIYDLVQAIQIEHGAVRLTPDGRLILEGDNIDKE